MSGGPERVAVHLERSDSESGKAEMEGVEESIMVISSVWSLQEAKG